MIRNHKPFVTPSRDPSPSKTQVFPQKSFANLCSRKENYNSNSFEHDVGSELAANLSTTKNPALVYSKSFDKDTVDDSENVSVDILSSSSFEETQTSILSAYSIPQMTLVDNPQVNAHRNLNSKEYSEDKRASDPKFTNVARESFGPRTAILVTGLQRQNMSTRKNSISTTTSGQPRSMDHPSLVNNSRPRRHSQFQNSSEATGNATNAPKKSTEPNSNDVYPSKTSSKRRPCSTTISQGLSEIESVMTGNQVENNGSSRGFKASRAAKAKSLQPPSRNGQAPKAIETVSKINIHSNEKVALTISSSRKRISVIPGMPSPSHPTGLGARTISPTDARRAKRMSNMQAQNFIPKTPPTPQSDSIINGSTSRPSSIVQNKTSTPCPSGISPDSNRKSNSSRLSPTFISTLNSNRETLGSLPSRSMQSTGPSRQQNTKSRNILGSIEIEEKEGEFVPPVPAIPKAYESPKELPTGPSALSKKKSMLSSDSSYVCKNLINSHNESRSNRELSKDHEEDFHRKSNSPNIQSDNNHNSHHVKKSLQPLRLPPFNLRPLSTTTANRFEVFEEQIPSGDKIADTISQWSPTTASKASFFANTSKLSRSPIHSRSNSAINFLGKTTNSSISVMPKPKINFDNKNTGLPSTSSSLSPKKPTTSYGCIPRNKPSDENNTYERSHEAKRLSVVNGPRALNLNVRSSMRETPPAQLSNLEEPSTPLSATSLRRKLSLGWRRSASKSSVSIPCAVIDRESGYLPPAKKADNTSPSRYPASSTISNFSKENIPSPSLSVKSTTYLDSKQRKSTASSMSMFGGCHDRTISDSWGVQNNSSGKTKQKSERSVPTTRTSSMMHRILNPKESSSSARLLDHWTIDLDKDDLTAEDEMMKLALKRKETEHAARHLDALTKRATAKDRMSPQDLMLRSNLTSFERGEMVDYKDIYFYGTPDAAKHIAEFSQDSINFGYDDDRGDYSIIPGDHLLYRYEIIDLLGKGSFGQVVRCVDHKTGGLVAVKIIRNKKRFHQQALVEVNILKKLREWDPCDTYNMVKFTQSFYFRGHLCISAELLDMNLYELIKSNSFRGFSLKIVRRFTKQILNSLLLLQKHKVIHCDLKPENVLLAHPLHSEIKVIDFGSSCFENEKVYTYIQSRFYRSPEVILGMTYGMPIDMWSLGCIMAELYSGVPIFPGENEQEQLACIMEVFGPPEKHLIEKSTRRKLFFDSMGKPRLTISSKGRRRRPSSKTLHQVLKCDDNNFLDFLSKCLKWDPDCRIKPNDAIRHEFITGQKSPPLSFSSRRSSSIRNDSPIKKSNTMKFSTVVRPLPEPPSNSHKKDAVKKNNEVPGSKGSPIKNSVTSASNQRRQSSLNGNISPSISNPPLSKRIAHGGSNNVNSSGSALPRVKKLTNGRNKAAGISSAIFPRNSSLTAIASSSVGGNYGSQRAQ
ncbi:putative dual specificity protein kinase pom1 [Golovinomyces cichoracearum]|uniref:Putative dual specificity protein kinase pom1 n=1 Tax=Golovinomyces cichoracearum TaxID=62708 RepID=A0A420IK83_9PEZI|nr:putative dual specificity protein kinase pom1 [Golovinomyces cichoracearum]